MLTSTHDSLRERIYFYTQGEGERHAPTPSALVDLKDISTRLAAIKPNTTIKYADITDAANMLTHNFNSFAHIIIDVQDNFCNPCKIRGNADTGLTTDNLIQAAPIFNQIGLLSAWVYHDSLDEGHEHAHGGFYKIKPPEDDKNILIRKEENSLFGSEGSEHGKIIDRDLKNRGIKNLIVSGFNFSSCVWETVLDASDKGFNVWVITDCTGNGNADNGKIPDKLRYELDINDMILRGATITSTEHVVRNLLKMAPPSTLTL